MRGWRDLVVAEVELAAKHYIASIHWSRALIASCSKLHKMQGYSCPIAASALDALPQLRSKAVLRNVITDVLLLMFEN